MNAAKSAEHRVRIAILTTSYPLSPGDAAGHFVEAEAKAFVREGHRVAVFCPSPASRPSRTFERNTARASASSDASADTNPAIFEASAYGAAGYPGVLARLRAQPWRALGLLAWTRAAHLWLTQHGPFDRIVCHWLFPAGLPIAAFSNTGPATLECVVHGSDARLLEKLPSFLQRTLLRKLAAKNMTLRCVSQELAQILRRAAGTLESCPPIRVQPAALEIELTSSKAEARAVLGLGAAERVIVVAGRLITSKRVDVALRATEVVGNATVVVLGTGPEHSRLRERYPNVRFLGQVIRPVALIWFRAANVVLSASRLEGAPSVIREARALGTSVVAVAAGDLADQASVDSNLWVLERSDSDTLSRE